MNDLRKSIGNVIRQKRKELAMTQQELAYAVGVDPKYISRIETGISYASLSVIEKMFEVLNLDIKLIDENKTTRKPNRQAVLHKINSNLKTFSDKKLSVVESFISYVSET